MFDFPVKYFEENIIVNNHNEWWAVYKLINFDYDFVNTNKKFEILESMIKFIANLGEIAKIFIIPIQVDYEDYFRGLEKNLVKSSRIYELSKYHINKSKRYVSENYENYINDYEVYIMTRLDKDIDLDGMKEVFSEMLTGPVNAINKYFGLGRKVSRRKLERYKNLAKDFQRQQNRRIKIEKCSEKDIVWLIKRSFYRGIEKTEMKMWERWQPYNQLVNEYEEEVLEVDKQDMVMNLSSGAVDLRQNRMVVVEHEEEKSYQSFLAVTKIPEEMVFPGNELFLYQFQFMFPVETCIVINNVPLKEALKKLERKKRSIDSQFEHIAQSDEVPEDVIEAKNQLLELESEIKSNNTPLARTSIYFCLYSNTKEVLKDNVKTFMNYYRDAHIGIERPIADQYKLFFSFIAGTGRYDKNYILPVTPRVVAAGMPGATSDLGDNVGAYIGRGGTLEKPVFLYLNQACLKNKPAAALVVGAQGYGKTFNTNLLVYNHILHFTARAFIIDPKGDRRDWNKKLPGLEDHVNVIEFKASEEDKGRLDPFIIYKDNMEEAGELAINIITELFNISTEGKTYLALQDSVEETKNCNIPCMKSLVEFLKNYPVEDECKEEASLLSRKIANLNKGGLQNLLYSEGRVTALDFNKKINIVMIQNLKLPASNFISKAEYSSEEKLGTVLMLAVSNFAKKFSQIDNRVPKIIVMDEAWALAKCKHGEDLFERLARTGRSLNTSVIFIGHSVNDITSEGIRNALRYKFVFNVLTEEEAIRTLKFLNMDITRENIGLLCSDENGLVNGECLFSDAEGRISVLKFDAVDENLVKAFKTTPGG